MKARAEKTGIVGPYIFAPLPQIHKKRLKGMFLEGA